MTDPFDDPTGRWGLIFHGSGLYRPAHTRQEWAQLAHAIRAADRLSGDMAARRGDHLWCQMAADTYAQLYDTDAYRQMRAGDEPRWHADKEIIRAWLDAPVVPAADAPATMLDAHGWQSAFSQEHPCDPAEVTIMVDLAQDAGVVGAPHHKLSVVRWVEHGVTRNDAFLILLWPPHGPARGSSPVDLDLLVQPHPTPADTIVGLLQATAEVANTLLDADPDPDASRRAAAALVDARARLSSPRHVTGRRLGNPARVFPPLRAAQPTPAIDDRPGRAAPPRPHPHR
jgi:hypothetical protein